MNDIERIHFDRPYYKGWIEGRYCHEHDCFVPLQWPEGLESSSTFFYDLQYAYDKYLFEASLEDEEPQPPDEMQAAKSLKEDGI